MAHAVSMHKTSGNVGNAIAPETETENVSAATVKTLPRLKNQQKLINVRGGGAFASGRCIFCTSLISRVVAIVTGQINLKVPIGLR